MQQEEFPNKVAENYDPASENIKKWFEANKEVLISRKKQGSESFRTENNFLFPYIEKEVDWTQHKTFKFNDGREVTEFPVKSEKIPIPGFLVDSVSDRSKIKIKQSVLFVKKLESTEYSPLLVRFYSLQENIDQVSYSHIPKGWNGIIEAFGMNDGHYITFNFKEGKMVSYSKILANEAKSLKLRNENKSSTCYTYLVENPSYVVCYESIYDCTIYSGGTSIITYCVDTGNSGPGGSNPAGDTFCEEFDCYAFPGGELGGELEEDDQIVNELTNPCASEIFESIGNASKINSPFEIGFSNPLSNYDFASAIYDLFKESQNFNLIIKNDNISGVNGTTTSGFNSSNGKKEVTITLSNHYLNNATQLSIARTIIHEMVHGYLIHELNSGNFDFMSDFGDKFENYLSGKNPDMNRAQHELMGGYVDMMAFSLKKWDSIFGDGNGNLGDDYYRAMAFGGLFKTNTNTPTDSFKALIPKSSDRLVIKNILKNEQDGNENAQGVKCD